MCAKYNSVTSYEVLEKAYGLSFSRDLELPQQTIYPHLAAPVLVLKDNKIVVELMSYSLVPSWAQERKPKFATYNARIEEVRTKPSWKEPFKSRHCIVPIVNFLESVYSGRFEGHNISIGADDDHVLSAAGIWDSWFDKKTGEVVNSFAIITTEPPLEVLEAGHDRCPVFLSEEARFGWLDAEKKKPDEWFHFLMTNQEDLGFTFTQGERLKGYTGQLSFHVEE